MQKSPEISSNLQLGDITEPKIILNLQLGDIIEIDAPTDNDLNNKTFLIQFLDTKKINLIGEDGNEQILLINEDGFLRNESITSISLLSRQDFPGYAQQNYLLPETWIDVHFDGDVPIVITGKITNLEEDQIEITTYGENEVIYIDFAYKGVPEDLPISNIVIREEPEELATVKKELTPESQQSIDELDVDDVVPVTDIQDQLRDIILQADQIIIGEKLGAVTQLVDVPEAEQRFGINKQTNDMLDELLSTIPNAQRTESVLNNIHLMIERFSQLRTEFSTFDEQNNALKPILLGANFKPLVQNLEKLNQKLYWILPIAKMKKKLYDIDVDVQAEYNDIVPLTLASSRIEEQDIIDTYRQNDVPDGENKYVYLLRSLQPFLTPYDLPDNPEQYLTNKHVETSITAVIDNLDDFYSSIAKNDDIQRKRFLIQEYSLGQNMLKSTKAKSGDIITSERQVTDNDLLTIKSMMTLPEPVVRFSHINLPATDIMIKANLNQNFIAYWRLLGKTSIVNSKIVSPLDESFTHDEDSYLNGITEFILDSSIETEDEYHKYLENIIPKTRVLFNLIKSHITGGLSVYAILRYLEPFMIYQKDISFKQYDEFVQFIEEKISEYKQLYINSGRELLRLSVPSEKLIPSYFNLLNADRVIGEAVVQAYELDKIPATQMQFDELWELSNSIDNNILYNTAIAYGAINLMTPNGAEQLLELDTWVKKTEETIQQNPDDCNQYILSKKYLAIDEMEEDNGKDIYFDKRYDKTYYDLLSEYKDQLDSLPLDSPINIKIDLLASKLKITSGLSDELARREAQAMIEGRRLVEEGDYALVVLEASESSTPTSTSSANDNGYTQNLYYKRRDNTWERDLSISSDAFTDKSKLFCDLNTNCIQLENQCQTNDVAEITIKNENLKKLIHEFDDRLVQNKEHFERFIIEEYKNALQRISPLIQLEHNLRYKYNNQKYEIGGGVEIKDIPTSPHEKIRDIILGQGDFVKRQTDITKFVSLWTRPPTEDEDPYWLYCTNTNIKLLPSFISTLASAFIINPSDYMHSVSMICKNQGTISDDQDSWVDKHSGYSIVPISFDNEEGYTESGFKIQSREILEADASETIIQGLTSKIKFESKDAEIVYNIANAMSTFIGIDLHPYSEFIIRNVMRTQGKIMPSQENYERAMAAAKNKGKKNLDSYEKTFNQSLIFITLCYFLIAIQTSIPSVRTRKRHPGCIRSFTGYPLDGIEDKTGLTYVGCIAHKIKSSIKPWSAISKLNQATIIKKTEQTLQKFIINNDEVQEKIIEKKEYIKLNPIEIIPIEHDIRNWVNFLPPLTPIKLGTVENISPAFSKQLETDLRTGSSQQNEKINVMRSKIIFLTLKIEELVQKTISKKTAILTNSLSEPFLENSCCDDGVSNTLDYFINAESQIAVLNNESLRLQNILEDLGKMAEASYLFDPQDTKLRYPEIPNEFSEETIYRAFIAYCKYNTDVPLSEELRAVCMAKPESFDVEDSIAEKIRKLRRDGHNYSIDSLNQLMQVINRNNIVHIQLHDIAMNNVQNLRDILESLDVRDITNIPRPFREKFLAMIDTFEIGGLMEDTEEMRDMKNYLATSNEAMQARIISFIQQNLVGRIPRDLLECIATITNFKEYENNINIENEDETVFKMINFIKSSIRTLSRVLPNIVINQVDYANVKIPTHWKLSERHVQDIKAIINKHYAKLYQFYSDKDIILMLERIQILCNDVNLLVENTQFFAPVRDGEVYMYSVFDRRMSIMLFKFYFFSVIIEYISLLEEDDIILRSASQSSEMLSEVLSPTVELLREEEQGVLSDIEIISGEKKKMAEKVASVLSVFINIICNDKSSINYNYSSLMERVHRAKEKEKDIITTYLKDLTDEEREIETLFKNNRLEKWSKGLQKGLRIYQSDTYDEERDTMEAQALIEIKLGQNDLVTAMNRNIFAMDAIEEQSEAQRIENEELTLDNLADDDDYGDDDGDEGY